MFCTVLIISLKTKWAKCTLQTCCARMQFRLFISFFSLLQFRRYDIKRLIIVVGTWVTVSCNMKQKSDVLILNQECWHIITERCHTVWSLDLIIVSELFTVATGRFLESKQANSEMFKHPEYACVNLPHVAEQLGLIPSEVRCIPQGTSINWSAPASTDWLDATMQRSYMPRNSIAEITLGARGWKSGMKIFFSLSYRGISFGTKCHRGSKGRSQKHSTSGKHMWHWLTFNFAIHTLWSSEGSLGSLYEWKLLLRPPITKGLGHCVRLVQWIEMINDLVYKKDIWKKHDFCQREGMQVSLDNCCIFVRLNAKDCN